MPLGPRLLFGVRGSFGTSWILLDSRFPWVLGYLRHLGYLGYLGYLCQERRTGSTGKEAGPTINNGVRFRVFLSLASLLDQKLRSDLPLIESF